MGMQFDIDPRMMMSGLNSMEWLLRRCGGGRDEVVV